MTGFQAAVDRLAGDSSDAAMGAVVAAALDRQLSAEEIAYLAKRLGQSPERLGKLPGPGADIASTGGPSSLSTLLCPLYLRALGTSVAKLSVPGRPAGGLDVLAQIPGYRVNLPPGVASRVLAECGYAHFAAGIEMAPLDAKLFRYRQKAGAQAVVSLAIASILAKKVAVGSDTVGLDIRVGPHGNLGRDWDSAKSSAMLFCEAARELNARAVCFLTDATVPYQRHIGRGEALVALSLLFEGSADSFLTRHDAACFAMAKSLLGAETAPKPLRHQIRRIFLENVVAQGASEAEFERVVRGVRESERLPITAPGDGFLAIDMAALRTALVTGQALGADASAPYPDSCGIELHAMPNDYVVRGELVAALRITPAFRAEVTNVVDAVRRAFSSSPWMGAGRHFEECRLA